MGATLTTSKPELAAFFAVLLMLTGSFVLTLVWLRSFFAY
jgi:hypothetical protein